MTGTPIHPKIAFFIFAILTASRVIAEDVEPLPLSKTPIKPNPEWNRISATWTCPELYKDAKFGLWLHWGPQSVPLKGGGWYARHMYMQHTKDSWGKDAWAYHRASTCYLDDGGRRPPCHHAEDHTLPPRECDQNLRKGPLSSRP